MQTIPNQQVSKQQPFLPLQLSIKYYVKWDCEIQTKSTHNGYFKCLQGKGQVQFTNGNKYKGNFRNGLMNGQGQFLWTNGMKYTGPFVNNAITGQGRYEWKDGSWYKGQLLNGKRHGKGEYFCSKDSSKYNGDWVQGLRHGQGLLQFTQDTSYEGQFQHGFRHGKGKMKYSTGNVYQGDWKKDKKCGYGIMNWFNQNQKYDGEWKDDLQNGLGTYYWFDGKIEYKIIKNIYKGNWVDGQRHGFGSFFYSNGCRYESYFAHNQKHGEGLSMDDNGNVRLECFQKDKLLYTVPDGSLSINGGKQITQKKQSLLQRKASQKKLQTLKVKDQVQSLQSSTLVKPASKLLPSVLKQKNPTNPSSPTNLQQSILTTQQKQFPPTQKQSKLKVQQNAYLKCLDIPLFDSKENVQKQKINIQQQQHQSRNQRFIITEQIANLLLRENSHLRQWYKYCSTLGTTATGNNANSQMNKDFYSGVTIDNLFKLIKDLKLMDEFITIPKINQQFFYLGWKSIFDINLPNEKKLKLIKDHFQKATKKVDKKQSTWQKEFNNQQCNYSNIQWVQYAQFLQNPQTQFKDFEENIDLNTFQDIHNPKKIILFRHFVCYLLRIAYLQTLKVHVSKNYSHANFQKQFRHHLEKLFKTINTLYENVQKQQKSIQSMNDNMTFVSKQRASYNISQEFVNFNKQLFVQITKNYQNLHNFSDRTISTKVLFQILEKFEILKQPTQKILFLQKIQRFMQPQYTKHSLLRKQLKSHFPSFEKVIYTSPYFHRILSYPLIEKEFQELLYLAVNRKIISSSKEDSIKKYRQVIDKMIAFVKNQAISSQGPVNQNKLAIKLPTTDKDKMKKKLIQQQQQRQAVLKQAQRKKLQLQREQIERNKMQKQDFRWEQDESESSQEYFD